MTAGAPGGGVGTTALSAVHRRGWHAGACRGVGTWGYALRYQRAAGVGLARHLASSKWRDRPRPTRGCRHGAAPTSTK